MAITATQEGRNLLIHVEGLDPFVVKPLPGNAGAQITETYLLEAVGANPPGVMALALAMALDGAVEEDGIWVPVPLDQRINSTRMDNELRLAELDTAAMVAFLWQTILDMNGVEIFLSAEGVEGHTKALAALAARTGLSPQTTSLSSASDLLTLLQGSSRTTPSPGSGVKNVKQPQDRQRKRRKRKQG